MILSGLSLLGLSTGFHTPSGVLREGGPLTSLFPYLLEVEAKVLNQLNFEFMKEFLFLIIQKSK